MKVAFETGTALGLRVARVSSRLLVEAVALVPAGTVLRPWAHAHPAELAAALLAGHMADVSGSWVMLCHQNSLAATVLLNRRLALGALLGVRIKPVGRLRVVRTLLLPSFDDLAQDGTVVGLEAAAKAQVVPALACDSRDHLVEHACRRLGALDGVLTPGVGAPAQVRRVLYERSLQEFTVSGVSFDAPQHAGLPRGDLWIHQLLHSFLPHDTVAAALHALHARTLALLLNLPRKVLLPAAAAEAM